MINVVFTFNARHKAFTLAELLIALGILGVIATFTIPKVLMVQQNGAFNARAKEAVSMISGAYSAYKLNNTVTANTTAGDLTPFMNFVAVDTSTTLDDLPGSTSFDCGGDSGRIICLKLHNGGMLEYYTEAPFAGTSSTNLLYFNLDPDSRYSGSATGEGKSIIFFLYFDGRISTWGNAMPGSYGGIYGGTSYVASTARDPSWFSW